MATFPRLDTGAVTQYPSSRRASYATSVTRFVDGSEQRFRDLKAPVRRWVIQLANVSPQEAGAIESFFAAMLGQFGSFAFVDPWDDTEYADCSFDQDTLTALTVAEPGNQTYLVIRNNSL